MFPLILLLVGRHPLSAWTGFMQWDGVKGHTVHNESCLELSWFWISSGTYKLGDERLVTSAPQWTEITRWIVSKNTSLPQSPPGMIWLPASPLLRFPHMGPFCYTSNLTKEGLTCWKPFLFMSQIPGVNRGNGSFMIMFEGCLCLTELSSTL